MQASQVSGDRRLQGLGDAIRGFKSAMKEEENSSESKTVLAAKVEGK
jgi:hypothetical protein